MSAAQLGWRLACLAALLGAACGGPEAGPSAGAGSHATLAPGVVARVGEREIRAETVALVAQRQHVTPPQALESVLRDALLALGAERGPVGASASVRVGRRGVQARALLMGFWQQAASGEATADELAAWSERRWLDVDRPEGYRTVHAIALFPPKADEAARERARELAGRLREALLPITERARATRPPERPGGDPFRTTAETPPDPVVDAFRAAASAVEADRSKVTAELLPIVAADGRVMDRDVQEGSSFELPYAEAAGRLRERGELSPVIGTSFGYHVILLLERVPALSLPADERRRVLRDDVRLGRARAAQRQLVGELRGRSRVDVVPNVDALLALPRVEP